MSKEPWRLSKAQRAAAEALGFGPEQIEEAEEKRRLEYERLEERALAEAGMSREEVDAYFEERYGFEHSCHCLEDKFTGRMVTTTLCEIEVKSKALIRLEEVNMERDDLAEKYEDLRRQLLQLGEEPVA